MTDALATSVREAVVETVASTIARSFSCSAIRQSLELCAASDREALDRALTLRILWREAAQEPRETRLVTVAFGIDKVFG